MKKTIIGWINGKKTKGNLLKYCIIAYYTYNHILLSFKIFSFYFKFYQTNKM